jgi:hypothetical protein
MCDMGYIFGMPPTDRTFSLAEIATILCGSSSPGDQRWVADRLRGYQKPTLPGYKARRQWRMTQQDLDTAIELLRPQPHYVPSVTSLTARSQRKLVG